MGGSTQYEGRVEVCIDDQWGTVSDNNWDNTDATVVCNQLAFNRSKYICIIPCVLKHLEYGISSGYFHYRWYSIQ